MVNGVKSKEFGVFWRSMMMIALCFPEKIDKKNKEHIAKIKHYKMYYDSLQHVIPCYFCRCFIKEVLMKKHPIDFTGRIPLMKSIFCWKNLVSSKLRAQGNKIKPNPSFDTIRKQYEKLYAVCDVKVGRCV